MLKPLFSLTTFLLLAGCAHTATQARTANPASEYCITQGGESMIQKDKTGAEYGICRFSDCTVIEEWEYFRQNRP